LDRLEEYSLNTKGQFSIIAALLVAVILITTVIFTYSTIRSGTIQNQPSFLSAIDETNLALKQILGFTVGYYGSVLQVTGNVSYAKTNATSYLQSGLQNVANMHPEWGASLNLSSSALQANWFSSTSYSSGNLTVNYNLPGLGIQGISYQCYCQLGVQIINVTGGQACLSITQDENQPLVTLGMQNFNFYYYNNASSTWTLLNPSTEPTAYANGTYYVNVPSGVNPYSYVVQVGDQRGIIVVASSFNSYTSTLTWNSTQVPTGSPSAQYYVNNYNSSVDSLPDMGTHSNFTAQQKTDGIYDNMTEANFPITSGDTQQFVQSNSSDVDANGDIGTVSNFTTEQYSDNIYDTLTEANTNVAYIPITFTNNQSSATPSTFQQNITWNPSSYKSYEASNLGNIRFYSDSNLATPLYAWLENCTPSLSNTATFATAWVKLTNPIAANGGTKTIYMAFLSITTSFDGNYWGEAPNLSGTYGAYDNGANVFNAYFNGNTATSSFSVYSGDTLTQATGISGPGGTTINAIEVTGSTGSHVPAFSFNVAMSNTALIVESSFCLAGNTGDETGAVGLVDNAAVTSIRNGISADMGWSGDYFNQAYEVAGAVTMPVNAAGTSTTSWVYASVTYPGSAASSWSAYIAPQLYSSTGGYSGTYSNNPLSSAANLYLGQISGSSAINVCYNFIRARADPPNNVMPSVSFGNVTFPQNYRLDLERQWTSAPYNANGSKLLCIKTGNMSTEALEVDVWTGSWTVLNTSLNANAWNNISVSSYLTAATFTIRFVDTITTNDTVQSTWQIDAVLLHTWNITSNYKLNLEEQWINVNYTNAQLCIKTGSLAVDALAVDAWNGSAWINVLGSLNANSWNNVTVSSYLQPSTFTIRFRSINGTYPDTVQDSWQIDAALLTVWPTVDLYSLSPQGTIVVELLQNGTMRWLGQNLVLTNSNSMLPFPPVPVRSIHVNETINGVNGAVPFQIEDWSSAYHVPLGLTSNMSIFSSRTMLVFLATPNASKVTIWWNGSDMATQTPFAYTNRYFSDSPSSGTLSNGLTTLQIQGNFVVNSTVGGSSSTANFMRINSNVSSYGSLPSYVITSGVVRDIVHQEAEWPNQTNSSPGGVINCSDIYADIVLTLPANATYYTYQLSLMFVQSQQNRTISDLCPVWLTSLTGQVQTENGTTNGLPNVSNASDLFYNYSASAWAHHWSQSISATNCTGIMFTDSANQNLYLFDSIKGVQTGALVANSTTQTIQLLPVTRTTVSFNQTLDPRMQDIVWCGAIATFNATTTPIYNNANQTGLWILVEYPPTVAVTGENN
jgi:hypothetical protein